MWRIGGVVLIERLGEAIGQFLHYPWQGIWHQQSQPTLAEVEQFARQAAVTFLDMLQDTAPGHRTDYGMPGQVTVVFATFTF